MTAASNIYTQHAPGRISDVRNLMGDSYPKLKAEMTWIDDGKEMAEADGILPPAGKPPTHHSTPICQPSDSTSSRTSSPTFIQSAACTFWLKTPTDLDSTAITAGGWLSTNWRVITA